MTQRSRVSRISTGAIAPVAKLTPGSAAMVVAAKINIEAFIFRFSSSLRS
jgi:hypothetical protein